eukprot:CAMPEP_0194289662 /NCGR_PEP_ID=MMETSP0169-20130528/39525_1 /TAXON_ID=218684 /ORGANISM="Corethron pennatum, Strain L29A3" /LENGTH=239 /DNA_ID=CAMNT_0039037007 /DNA_START=222 /DNA_END=939 /DNA_ORIENTATION=-
MGPFKHVGRKPLVPFSSPFVQYVARRNVLKRVLTSTAPRNCDLFTSLMRDCNPLPSNNGDRPPILARLVVHVNVDAAQRPSPRRNPLRGRECEPDGYHGLIRTELSAQPPYGFTEEVYDYQIGVLNDAAAIVGERKNIPGRQGDAAGKTPRFRLRAPSLQTVYIKVVPEGAAGGASGREFDWPAAVTTSKVDHGGGRVQGGNLVKLGEDGGYNLSGGGADRGDEGSGPALGPILLFKYF